MNSKGLVPLGPASRGARLQLFLPGCVSMGLENRKVLMRMIQTHIDGIYVFYDLEMYP